MAPVGQVVSLAAPTIEVLPTEQPTQETVIREEAAVMVVTATPTVTPEPTATPNIQYVYVDNLVEVPVEVVKEVTVTPVPTVGVASGSVEICARVEGATALYIGGFGVASGQCQTFSFGVGQTSIQVQVNK